MKRKIFLAIATIFGLALVLGLTNVNLVTVKADSATPTTPNNLNKLSAYSYKLEYILEEAGYSAFVDGGKIADGRKVEFALTNDGTNDVTYPSEKAEADMTKTEKDAKLREAASAVEFITKGVYTFTVTDTRTGEGVTNDPVTSFTVNTTAKPAEDNVKYDLTNLASYEAKITEALQISDTKAEGGKRPIKTGDSFTVPAVESLIDCDYFDFEDLTKTVYYAAPQGSYTSTTSTSFKVNAVGTYSYYVLVKDPLGNTTKVSDLVVSDGGWYAKDADGNAIGSVIVPIFTFDVGVVTEPDVVVGESEKAFLNLAYEVECFTITATGAQTKYKLYYSESKVDTTASDYMDKLTEVTEENGFEEKNLLNESSLSFTPVKKGYYYVALEVRDTANVPANVISNPIAALDEFKEVKLEFDIGAFLSNNLMSVICIGVALICLVAIIVLLCVKPKEEKNLETNEESK